MREEQSVQLASEKPLSDQDIERLRRERFAERVQRVLAVMREERVDWRGAAFVTPDGRIAVRVMPVPMQGAEGEVREP
jgi:alkanesulfonate monooxygenase SsuD/methylene tetrahydromethanopterin reductase-like flavin-dependent oxidoreductase (luciferase family)